MNDAEIIKNFCSSADSSSLPLLSEKIKKFSIKLAKICVKKNKGNVVLAKKIIEKLDNIVILSWNVNGIRSRVIQDEPIKKCGGNVVKKDSNLGVLIEEYNPDIICFQETKCGSDEGKCIDTGNYHSFWNCSKKSGHRGPGYSGTSIWSKEKPISILYDLPTLPEPDQEGRIIVAEYANFVLINTYAPNAGTNFEYRVNVWDPSVTLYLKQLKDEGKNVVWTGDMNVAHSSNDVYFANPESSLYNPSAMSGIGKYAIAGFTKEEREGFGKILDIGYTDVFRKFNPLSKDDFTYWNPRIPKFRVMNKGWLIDRFVVSDRVLDNVISTGIIKDSGMLTKPYGSDHAAIWLKIKK